MTAPPAAAVGSRLGTSGRSAARRPTSAAKRQPADSLRVGRPLPPGRPARAVTIVDAIADPNLFARWFRDRETWRAWFVFLRALFGLPMSADDLALYRQCTGRDDPPPGGAREAWLVVGRRGGKSMVLALIAVFLACFCDWAPFLSPGERGTIMVLAADRRQARTIYRYGHGSASGLAASRTKSP